jgi:hypothetical protein
LPDFDAEQDVDDAEEDQRDLAVEDVVVAETLDAMRMEIAELTNLVGQAERARAAGEEAKLTALRRCLDHPDLLELRDGRAKLLIFTEHRDTLDYLERHLRAWGFETCTIHGGMAPVDRRQVQQDFHQHKQVCIATEAAGVKGGEGINLQFCHLMVNYDLPWNPVRLDQPHQARGATHPQAPPQRRHLPPHDPRPSAHRSQRRPGRLTLGPRHRADPPASQPSGSLPPSGAPPLT